MARLSPFLVEQIVSTLTVDPDRCVVMAPGMNPEPRVVREGKRWSLHRYLYFRLTGIDLPRSEALLWNHCGTRGCMNPFHRKVTRRRGVRRVCPNGHPYTAENTIRDQGRYRCRICWEARHQRPRKTTCRQGHPLTEDNLYRWTDASGFEHSRCRQCQIDRQHAYRNRQKKENR